MQFNHNSYRQVQDDRPLKSIFGFGHFDSVFSLCSINVPKFVALSLDLVPFFPVQCGHEPGQLCLVAGPVHSVQCPLAT